MSYSSLGQTLPATLKTNVAALPSGIGAQIAAAASSISQDAGKNRIVVPADCASIRSIGSENTAFDPAKELREGEWYLWAIPLAQTLTDPQAAALKAAFEGAFFPYAAQYPVNVTTPCDRGVRDAHAERCNREPKTSYIPHKQDNAKVSIEVQKHNDEASRGKAKHYISIFHQFTGPGLDGKKFFPGLANFIGYRNIEGSPMFLVAFQMNPDPKVDVYGVSGSVESGNVARGSMPSVKAVVAQRLFVSALKKAAGIAGLGSNITFGDNPMNAIVKLNRVRVELRLSGKSKSVTRAGSPPSPTDPPGRVVTEIRDLPQDYRVKTEMMPVFDSAIDQAAAYINQGISIFASLIGALFAQVNVNSRTDSLVRSAYASSGTLSQRMAAAKAAVESAPAIAAAARPQAEAQLKNPDHYQAIRAVQSLRRDVARKVQEIQWGDESLAQTAAQLVSLAQTARESDALIRKGLDEAIARARTATKMHPTIRRSMECNAIRKARREQELYPDKLAGRAEQMATSATEWATTRPQRDAAMRVYQELDAFLQEIERRIPLPWWAKPLGPLPVWAWGAVGVGTFLGGAVLVRRSRKKAKARTA